MAGTRTICNTFKHTYQSNTFGGIIYESDFDTEYRVQEANGSSFIASRIASSWKFDQQCLRNSELRDKKELHKQKREAI